MPDYHVSFYHLGYAHSAFCSGRSHYEALCTLPFKFPEIFYPFQFSSDGSGNLIFITASELSDSFVQWYSYSGPHPDDRDSTVHVAIKIYPDLDGDPFNPLPPF